MDKEITMLCGDKTETITENDLKSASEELAKFKNKEDNTITFESPYSSQINLNFLQFLNNKSRVFTVKNVFPLIDLMDKYNCEKYAQEGYQFLVDYGDKKLLCAGFKAIDDLNSKSKTARSYMIHLFETQHGIIFNDSILHLHVETLFDFISNTSSLLTQSSLLFAFVLLQIKLNKEKAEPFLSLLEFDKLVVPQMLDLRKSCLKNNLPTVAFLVGQELRARESIAPITTMAKIKHARDIFMAMFESSISLSVKCSEGREFDGIFEMIRRQNGRNPALTGMVHIRASSNDPSMIIGTKPTGEIWMTANEQNPFIQFDADEPLVFDSYTLSGPSGKDPLEWDLFVSNDGHKWELIDSHRLKPLFTSVKESVNKIYDVPAQSSRHIRFVLASVNPDGSLQLALRFFELLHEGKGVLRPRIDDNTLMVTSSSNSLASVIEPTRSEFWHSRDVLRSSIVFSFTGFQVALSSYTLQTYDFPTGRNHLKSWVVQGSDDGENWFEIDRRNAIEDLNFPLVFKNFEVKSAPPAKHIRIMLAGMNANGKHIMVLNSVEFFGTIVPGE